MKTATVKDNKIVLKFYSSDSSEFYRTLEKVKAIDGRRFNANTKFWTIPLNESSIQQITDIGFALDDSISQALKTNQQHAAEQQAKIIELQQSISIDEKKLYPYQSPHAKLIIQSLIMNNAALDASDTGTGKTYVACAAAQYLNLDIIVLTPKSVIASWYKAAKYFGIKCFAINYEQYRTGKIKYLQHSKSEDGKDRFKWLTDEKHLLVFDECFPYHTPIMTNKGAFSIGNIVENNLNVKVLSFNSKKDCYEYKKIKHRSKKLFTEKLIQINLENGEHLICTPNHKIWIKEVNDYVEAKNITDKYSVQMVRESIQTEKLQKPILFKKMQNETSMGRSTKTKRTIKENDKATDRKKQSNEISCFETNERKQSNDEKRSIRKNEKYKNKKRNMVPANKKPWGKWKTNKSTNKIISDAKQQSMGIRISNITRKTHSWLSKKLQSRYSKSNKENCNRNRWKITQFKKEQRAGQKENQETNFIRVESIKVYQSRDYNRTEKMFVYNFEVVDNHNYFANNILVSNCHRCKNEKTLNSKMLRAAKRSKSPVLALSATIADNPLHLYSLGLVLGLFEDYPSFWNWAYKHGVYKSFFGVEFNPKPEFLQKIHQQLFPAKGSRIRIADLGDAFPDNLIITDSYDMNSNAKKIQSAYRKMDGELQRLYATKEKDKGSSILTEILRARQEIELLKVPTIIEMAEDLIEEGNSIAIFVNFKETISVLSQKLKCDCIIDGSITGEQREKNIEAFQSDQSRIILCNIKAGGVGISLHDLNGTYPRVSLISPTNSAVDLVQALGRIHRAGAKSKAIQRLLFCAGTIEEEIAQNVSVKIQNITLINDGDLTGSIVINIKQQGDSK
jgi:superfamily II DNA or RNA helicase